MKPSQRALGQPLRIAAPCVLHRIGEIHWTHTVGGDKRLIMVVMFVDFFVLGDDPNIDLFLPYKT